MSDTPHTRTNRAARRLLYGVVGAALLSIPTLAVADEVFSLTQNIPITGLASFDISFVDASISTYFLADRSNKDVDVIDTATKAVSNLGAGDFAGVQACSQPNACNGPNGVLTVHQGHGHNAAVEVWVADAPHGAGSSSNPSTVKVFSFPGGTLTHTISTGGTFRADEGCWDPQDHLVLIANDAELPSPFITFISTDTYTVVQKIVFDGGSGAGHGPNATNGIEQCQWNAREHAFYLNLPEVNGAGNDTSPGEVVVINPRTFHIDQAFVIPLANCAGPQGMALGPKPQIALGCNAPTEVSPGVFTGGRNSVVIDEDSGNVIATLPNEGGSDEIWFNPGDGHYFFANSTPGSKAPLSPQFLGIVDSHSFDIDQTIVTQAASAVGAHSVAADPALNQAYVPISGGINIYTSNKPDDVAFVHRHHDND